MAFIGKLLTLFILLTSLVFLGISVMNYATQQNWKEAVQGGDGQPGLQQQLTDFRNQVRESEARLKEARDRIALEQAARRSALATLEIQSKDIQAFLEQKQQVYEDAQRELDRNIATLSTAQQDVKQLQDQVNGLRSEGKELLSNRNAELDSVVDLTDKVNQAEGPLRRLTERSKQLRGG